LLLSSTKCTLDTFLFSAQGFLLLLLLRGADNDLLRVARASLLVLFSCSVAQELPEGDSRTFPFDLLLLWPPLLLDEDGLVLPVFFAFLFSSLDRTSSDLLLRCCGDCKEDADEDAETADDPRFPLAFLLRGVDVSSSPLLRDCDRARPRLQLRRLTML